jgi:hypothetical protein
MRPPPYYAKRRLGAESLILHWMAMGAPRQKLPGMLFDGGKGFRSDREQQLDHFNRGTAGWSYRLVDNELFLAARAED